MEQTFAPVHATGSTLSATKRRARFYRMVFFHLGAILLVLSAIVFLARPHWLFYDIYLGYCLMLKGLIGSFSGLLGAAAIGIGCSIRAETDALYRVWHAARQRLDRLYQVKLARWGLNRLSSLLDEAPEGRILRSQYLKTRDALLEQRRQTLLVLQRMRSHTSEESALERERQANDILLRFEQSAARILVSYGEE